MKKITFFLIGWFMLQYSFGQQVSYLKDEEAVRKHAESVTQSFSEKDFDKAFEILKKHWLLPETELIQFQTLTLKQLSLVEGRYGGLVDYKFIKDNKVSDVLLKKTYVIRYQNHLLILYFTYYNNDTGWTINSFKWNDSIEDLF